MPKENYSMSELLLTTSLKMEGFEDKLIELISTFPGIEHKETRDLLISNFPEGSTSTLRRDEALRQDLTIIIKFIIRMGRVRDAEISAIEILIKNAKDLVRGLEKEDQLDSLLQEFQNENQAKEFPQIPQTHTEILIPFVIVSMTFDGNRSGGRRINW